MYRTNSCRFSDHKFSRHLFPDVVPIYVGYLAGLLARTGASSPKFRKSLPEGASYWMYLLQQSPP